jgi:HSP20 family protein
MNTKTIKAQPRGNSLFGRDMEDLFSQVVSAFEGAGYESPALAAFKPRTDIAETAGGFELTLELPGMSAENIDVEYHDNILTISGERTNETETNEKKFHRIERQYGSFSRSFRMKDIDGEKVHAEFKDGLLKVIAPKMESVKPKKIEIRNKNGN